jgi:signal transduction histidine kinase
VISNAIKFTGAGGNVTLKTEIVNDSVVISISDNGIGMTEDKLEKILKADTLVSTAGTNNELGSGLGLVIVRDFVKKNNGKFNIASEPGKGTTVTIVLPKEKPN